MVRFSFTIAQAIQWALVLISEVQDASPLLAGFGNLHGGEPIRIYVNDGIDLLAKDTAEDRETSRIQDFSFNSLVEGYEKYGHIMKSLHDSCKPFVRLNKKNIKKYGKESSIEVIRDAESEKQIIVEAKSKHHLGEFIYPFRAHCIKKNGKSEILSEMKYEAVNVYNTKIEFMDFEGNLTRYDYGASFADLERIMKHQDPFKKLAILESKRILKIEYAVEDQINGKFSILYSDFFQTAPLKNTQIYMTNGKAMGYFSFFIDEGRPRRHKTRHKKSRLKNLLSQPLMSKRLILLKWNSQTQKYDLEKLTREQAAR